MHEPASIANVNIAPRDDVLYVALARNTSDIPKTEDFIKSKIRKGTSIYQMQSRGETIGWGDLSLDPEAKKDLENYDGIETIYERRVGDGLRRRKEDLKRRGIRIYAVLARDPKNQAETQASENFLKFKAEKDERLLRMYTTDGLILGWKALALSESAKNEVEQYEALKLLIEDKPLVYYMALPHNNQRDENEVLSEHLQDARLAAVGESE